MFEELEAELVEVIAKVISDYLDDIEDPGEVESHELAESIAHELKREKK
jgi:hypothetical protein